MPHAAEWDLSQTGTETVFFLGPSALENGFIQEAVKLAWKPIVLVPGYVAGKQIFDAPSAFEGRILVAYPTLPLDQSVDALAEYRTLLEHTKSPLNTLARSWRHCRRQKFWSKV